MFPKITNEQLVATKNNNVQLRTYNKTTITQLGTCIVEVEHKNNKKKCTVFVVPSNGQASLCMPEIDMLNILKLDSYPPG